MRHMDEHQHQVKNGQPKATIKHFSHPHILNLIKHQQNTFHHHSNPINTLCSGCNLAATSSGGSTWLYSCAPCGYFLHVSCSRMPPKITHPCCGPHSGGHVLRLRHGGEFICAACRRDDNCFSYNCKACSLDLHTACAAAPLSLPAGRLHRHPLRLEFSPPYLRRSFSCAACRRAAVKGWLYRCEACAFDVHFDCAKLAPNRPDVNQHYVQNVIQNHPNMVPNNGFNGPTNRQQSVNMVRVLIESAARNILIQGLTGGGTGIAGGGANAMASGVDQTGSGCGVDPTGSGCGVDPTGYGSGVDPTGYGYGVDYFGAGAGGGGFDPAAMSGSNLDPGAVSASEVDFGGMTGGGFDFSWLAGLGYF